MPSCQSVPRIRVDLLDSSPRDLSPSGTLDIKDVLGRVEPLPKLLAKDFVFDDVDDDLYLDDDRSQDVPPFPTRREPLLFILNPHRVGLPFPIRPEAFELDDFCWGEEDTCAILTAPTIPRMKLMIKEQLYVQKWVDTLTSENPPKHIPWTCERPAMERRWIAEGSIFPAAVIEYSDKQRGVIEEHPRVTDTNRSSALANQAPYSGGSCAFSEMSVPVHVSTESRTLASNVLVKSVNVDPGIPHGESKISQTPLRIVRALMAHPPPTLLPSGPVTTAVSSTPNAPLAARRGKPLVGLKLKESVVEQLEYPDIPTAFRGSPGIWSPRFGSMPVPSFTDHQSMLLNLKSKCAALGSGPPAYIQEPLHSETDTIHSSFSVDEWTFARGLATFDNDLLGSICGQIPGEFVTDTSVFLPGDSSTPGKDPNSNGQLGFAPRLHSAPVLQPPLERSSDPPGDPLPPRPALISPSTPPNVRGILKKVKSVRFEDTIIKEPRNHASPVVHSPQAPPEGPSSLPLAVPSERPRTPAPKTPNLSSVPVLVEASGRNTREKKCAPRPRLPPKRSDPNETLEPVHSSTGKTAVTSKPILATTSIGRPCRVSRVKENADPAAVFQDRAKQTGLSITDIDLRRGIEGTTKGRLSTPLRNIFRFR